MHEAARLQVDLARTGITPRAWVINQSLTAAAPTDPLLAARAASEHRYLTEVADILADRLVVLPRVAPSPCRCGPAARTVRRTRSRPAHRRTLESQHSPPS